MLIHTSSLLSSEVELLQSVAALSAATSLVGMMALHIATEYRVLFSHHGLCGILLLSQK
jgi:hypothetical protein